MQIEKRNKWTTDTMLNHCFTPRTDYSEGTWRPRAAGPTNRYRINATLWEELGTSIRRSTPQHYGRCDDVMPNRTLYDWVPHDCSLRAFDVAKACKVLKGRTLMFVGDSTVFQLFLSFALLLKASLGRNVKRAATVSELTASACDDHTRLLFTRSDLLLWTSNGGDFNSVKRCDGYTNLQVFAQRAARDADLVVLGLGHHFPGSLDMAIEKRRGGGDPMLGRMTHHAFLPANLNHTLASLIAARAAHGHEEPPSKSIMLVGTTTPVAGCSRFHSPISMAKFSEANYDHRRTVDSPMWLSYARHNQLGKWVAKSHGIHFLDVSQASAQRPDGAMARFWPEGGYKTACNGNGNCALKDDCVHYCLPGPGDCVSECECEAIP